LQKRIFALGMQKLASPVLALVMILSLFTVNASAEDSVKIIDNSSFIDSEGRLNVVGTIRNSGTVPVKAIIALNVEDKGENSVVQSETYGRTIWPLNDSPFKFVIDSGNASEPFIMNVSEVDVVNYGMLVLNYSSMAAGEERAFVGTIRNDAEFDVHNVSVFASVRGYDATQLDTVRSNIIPVLKAGEEQSFMATPDAAIRSSVYYYSCAGLDYDDPIPTIDDGNGKFIPYTMTAAAQVSGLRYENVTDSIAFGIRPYSPSGGDLKLKIPQLSENQTVAVMLDGKFHEASIRGDSKTLYIDFFVPQGDHQVEIQGVKSVPELPLATLLLATMTAGIVLLARFKVAFKIP
jgi:hypothetical protein